MKHKRKSIKVVIFTDLDGTLLDERYDYQSVRPIIDELLALNASIVLCSSKTRAEIEFYRKEMRLSEPFVVENGSAIFIPKGYFPSGYAYSKQTARYCVIELGIPYSTVREKLARLKLNAAAEIVGFGDMTAEEIAKDSGLPLQLAELSKMREYDEPFRIVEGDEKEVWGAIEKEGLNWMRGDRYFHLLGNTDKGKATAILRDLYAQKFGEIATFGIGDSSNDQPMLKAVDTPFLFRKEADKNTNMAMWREILKLVAKHSSRAPNLH